MTFLWYVPIAFSEHIKRKFSSLFFPPTSWLDSWALTFSSSYGSDSVSYSDAWSILTSADFSCIAHLHSGLRHIRMARQFSHLQTEECQMSDTCLKEGFPPYILSFPASPCAAWHIFHDLLPISSSAPCPLDSCEENLSNRSARMALGNKTMAKWSSRQTSLPFSWLILTCGFQSPPHTVMVGT